MLIQQNKFYWISNRSGVAELTWTVTINKLIISSRPNNNQTEKGGNFFKTALLLCTRKLYLRVRVGVDWLTVPSRFQVGFHHADLRRSVNDMLWWPSVFMSEYMEYGLAVRAPSEGHGFESHPLSHRAYGPGQAAHAPLPQSPSSIIWY